MEVLYCLLALAGFVGLWFLTTRFFNEKLIEPIRKWPYTKFEKCDPPLGTINGIGFSLCGGSGRFDYDTNSTAHYLFFCFFIPLIPLGCYRAQEVANSGKGSSYRIFGHEKWIFWEVIQIYLTSIAWAGGVISLICAVCAIFD